jgi:hypothetical protein
LQTAPSREINDSSATAITSHGQTMKIQICMTQKPENTKMNDASTQSSMLKK